MTGVRAWGVAARFQSDKIGHRVVLLERIEPGCQRRNCWMLEYGPERNNQPPEYYSRAR